MRLLLASVMLAFLCLPAQASSLNYCDPSHALDTASQDRMIRVAAIVKRELEATGQPAALVSRSGLALGWLGERYSHAGVSSRASSNAPWSVRQLYFSCDEQRPRIFDQGMSGFVLGVHDAAEGYLSIVTLPPEAARRLDEAARHNATALALLGPDYSANAYPYATRYQNCNQWLAELLAAAWADSPVPLNRQQAQDWLLTQGYRPAELQVWWPVLAVARLFPWLYFDDHPHALLSEGKVQVSLPPALEQMARKLWPEAQRMEICYTPTHVVIHRGWDNIADGCVARQGDTVIALDKQAASGEPVLSR